MDFKKDLLIIDTEFSGFDLSKHELLQLAAVQLDRKTLKEKKFFNSYIKPKKWRYRDASAMRINQITSDMVKDAPELAEVIKKFDGTFKPDSVMLTSYTGYADKRFLLDAYAKAKVEWKFDYHYFDVWSVAYAYLAKSEDLKSRKDYAGFGIDYLMPKFGIEAPAVGTLPDGQARLHDALVDCRVEAEILRKVIGSL